MKKNKLMPLLQLLVLFSFWIASAAAQPGGGPPSAEKKEEIEAMKVAFLTRKLDLTSEEAKTFWPVYNQYQDELDKIREARGKQRKSKEDMESMSDKDLEKIVDGEIVSRQAELDVLKKYNSQFKGVLPMKKVAKLYRAEEDFKRELLHKLQERPRGGGPPAPQRDER